MPPPTKATEFDFAFRFQGKRYNAICQKFKPKTHMMWRVRIPKDNPKKEQVHILYEVNEKRKKFFWHGSGLKGELWL